MAPLALFIPLLNCFESSVKVTSIFFAITVF
jgi:hypothetical protein